MTKTFGLTAEQQAFITKLHEALSVHADLLNKSALTRQDMGSEGPVKNPAQCLKIVNVAAAGQDARAMAKGPVGSLYLAHGSAPFRILSDQIFEDKTIMLSCYTLSNTGTNANPSVNFDPHLALAPIRIEFEPETNKVRVLQDLPGGEILHGEFSMAAPKDFAQIMAIIRKRTNSLRLTAISNDVLHPLPHKLGEAPDPDADPNKDNLIQRRQVMDTLIAYIHAAYPTPENIFVSDLDSAYGGYPLQRFSERNGFRPPQGLEGCVLDLILDPDDRQRVRATLKRIDGAGEAHIIAVMEGDRLTFLRDTKTGESSYPALKKAAASLPMQAAVNFDFRHS